MRNPRLTLTLAAGLCALAVGACGDDPAEKDPAGARADKGKDAALAYARCMRENGVDLPDPKTDENGMLVIEGPQEGGNPGEDPDFRTADGACRKHLDAALPPKLDEAEQKEFKAKALAHAKCMREQGIDFPDPRVGEGGEVSVQIGGEGGIDPASPKFQAAQKACGTPFGPVGPGK